MRSSTGNRSAPLFSEKRAPPRGRSRAGEIAGGAAAECTVVCCCCPCAVMELLVLVVYKVPAGLCKKVILKRKQKRLLKKKQSSTALLRPMSSFSRDNKMSMLEDYLYAEMEKQARTAKTADQVSEAAKLEKEMWARFYGTGFWRNPSQRETS